MDRTVISTADVHMLPDLTPKHDEQLSTPLMRALSGEVPIYFAAVPLALCIPFDVDYRPDRHPVGAVAIDQTAEAWRKGQFQNLVVYQRGVWFIVSDDYIPLFAALGGLPDYVPCWILGKPESELLRDVQGPVAVRDVPRLLGLGARGKMES